MNTKKEVKCVHCGENATTEVQEQGVTIPLCLVHYRKYVAEEEVFYINNVENLDYDEA